MQNVNTIITGKRGSGKTTQCVDLAFKTQSTLIVQHHAMKQDLETRMRHDVLPRVNVQVFHDVIERPEYYNYRGERRQKSLVVDDVDALFYSSINKLERYGNRVIGYALDTTGANVEPFQNHLSHVINLSRDTMDNLTETYSFIDDMKNKIEDALITVKDEETKQKLLNCSLSIKKFYNRKSDI